MVKHRKNTEEVKTSNTKTQLYEKKKIKHQNRKFKTTHNIEMLMKKKVQLNPTNSIKNEIKHTTSQKNKITTQTTKILTERENVLESRDKFTTKTHKRKKNYSYKERERERWEEERPWQKV